MKAEGWMEVDKWPLRHEKFGLVNEHSFLVKLLLKTIHFYVLSEMERFHANADSDKDFSKHWKIINQFLNKTITKTSKKAST
jgi:hypothetical protein